MKEILRVRIISCDLKTAWYYDHAGDIYDVVSGGTEDYILAEDYERGYKVIWRHILKSDCQIIGDNDKIWARGFGDIV